MGEGTLPEAPGPQTPALWAAESASSTAEAKQLRDRGLGPALPSTCVPNIIPTTGALRI